MHKLLYSNDILFLITIHKQDQKISPCSCSRLSLLNMGFVLVRCYHTVTGLRTLFLFLLSLDLLWNSLVPSNPYSTLMSAVYCTLLYYTLQYTTECSVLYSYVVYCTVHNWVQCIVLFNTLLYSAPRSVYLAYLAP